MVFMEIPEGHRPPLKEFLERTRMSDVSMVAAERNEDGSYKIFERGCRPYSRLPPFWSLERRNWHFLALVPCFLIGVVIVIIDLDLDWDATSPVWKGPRSFLSLLLFFCNPSSGWSDGWKDYLSSLIAGNKASFLR